MKDEARTGFEEVEERAFRRAPAEGDPEAGEVGAGYDQPLRVLRLEGEPPAAAGRFRPSVVLCAVFFLSGASGLIFETLWFRLAGLAFGNSVWASAVVLSSFMCGLALGNWLAARHGGRVLRPVRLYAKVELAVAASGILLVLSLPRVSSLLAPVLRPLLDHEVLLNATRLSISFLLLMVPATAMGMTLPLLVEALQAGTRSFGNALGRLYGWNTLGAVAGALAGELLFIRVSGIAGSALWAGSFNVLAAAGALTVAGAPGTRAAAGSGAEPARSGPVPRRARRRLAASFLAGGILLALEVVWFRFLQLFFPGTTLTFAVMLSVVLAGIGLGGLAAAHWFRRDGEAHRWASLVAAAAGIAAVLAYSSVDAVLGGRAESAASGHGLGYVALWLVLMFPVSFLSGVLFSLIGHAVHDDLRQASRSTGLVTMWNTFGAALGPLAAGFLLIPRLGMERSFFVLALLYGLVFLLLHERAPAGARSARRLEYAAAAAFAVTAALFPFGRMERYVGIASSAYRKDGSQVVAVREGLTETLQYLRKDFLGRPLSYRLVTNGFSMAGTHPAARRYMKYYVYWPVAVHPDPREALLISFGTGSTAKALTDTAALESIVVVDISREVLEMAGVVFPGPGENPLDDPRVEQRVEDGRFFLKTTDRRFDIITSEPPPLKLAGVVNLYTREYFQLIHDRLAEGGITTYWLPVVQLTERETRSVLRAFLDVFGDEATVWTGSGLDWMLVGTRDAAGPVPEERFRAQWSDPVVAPELRALGFEDPGQIGATFLMGAEDLRELTRDVAPLTDDRPLRLSAVLGSDTDSMAFYARWMAARPASERFERSAYVRRLWPETLRESSLGFFPAQEALDRITVSSFGGQLDFALLHHLLTRTKLQTPVLWACGCSAAIEEILAEAAPAEADRDGRLLYFQGVGAMAERDYDRAARLLAESDARSPRPDLLPTRAYLLCMAGRLDDARRLVGENATRFAPGTSGGAFLDWLTRTVGFERN